MFDSDSRDSSMPELLDTIWSFLVEKSCALRSLTWSPTLKLLVPGKYTELSYY